LLKLLLTKVFFYYFILPCPLVAGGGAEPHARGGLVVGEPVAFSTGVLRQRTTKEKPEYSVHSEEFFREGGGGLKLFALGSKWGY